MKRSQLIPTRPAARLTLPVITTASLPVATQGAAYTVTLAATGGTPNYSWSITGALDSGLALNGSTGVISGVPVNPSATPLTVTVTDFLGKQGVAVLTLTIVASNAPSITSTSPLPSATVGVAYSVTLAATGGTPAYVWSYTGALTANLVLNTVTGVIAGTPTTATTSTLTMKVTDSASNFSTKVLSLPVQAGAALVITTASPLTSGVVGTAYSTTLAATGGAAPYSWSIDNTGDALPAGLTLTAATGVIAGTPTTVTNATTGMNVRVTDAGATQTVKSLSFSVASAIQVPSAPVPVQAFQGDTTTTLEWTPPTSSGGAPITAYNIYNGVTLVASQTPSAYSFITKTVTGLTNGIAVTFNIAAVNSGGTGPTAAFSPVTPGTPCIPDPPTNVVATTGPGVGQITLTWTAPAHNGGSAIANYNIGYYTGGVFHSPGITSATTSITASMGGPGSTLFFVNASNSTGIGPYSQPSNAVTPTQPGLPLAPTNLQILFQGMNAAGQGGSASAPAPTNPNTQAIGWTQAVQGTNPITQNRIYRSTNGAAPVIVATIPADVSWIDTAATNCVGSTALPHNAQGQAWAANGYLYQVSAIDSLGQEGPLSGTQIFVYYKSGVKFGMGGDVNNAVTSNYTDTTGASPYGAQSLLNTVNGSFGDWLPYAGTNATQWNIWCGVGSPAQVFAYLYISLKPSVSNQTWNAWAEYRTDTNTDPHGSVPGCPGLGNAAAVFGPQSQAGVWATYKLPLSKLMITSASDYGSIVGGMFYKLGFADQTGTAPNHYWVDNVYFSAT